MSKGDFKSALLEAEAARAQRTLPRDSERRLRERFEAAHDRRHASWLFRFGGGLIAAAAALALVVYAGRGPDPAEPRAGVNGFELAQTESKGALVPAASEGVTVQGGPVKVTDRRGRMQILASAGTQLRREPAGVRVVHGSARFSVDKRRAGEAPAVVLVSHGAIEVLGTQFTVTQTAEGGEVRLHEGRIQFRSSDGQLVQLAPGDSLSWPLAPKPTAAAPGPDEGEAVAQIEGAPGALPADTPSTALPAPAPARPNRTPKVSARRPELDVEGLIEEVQLLRRRGLFAEAASKLEAVLRQPLPPSTAERLSYELGSILTWQLKDATRGCALWRSHREAHPGGRYAEYIRDAEAALGCR